MPLDIVDDHAGALVAMEAALDEMNRGMRFRYPTISRAAKWWGGRPSHPTPPYNRHCEKER